jgi:hypothetical protein
LGGRGAHYFVKSVKRKKNVEREEGVFKLAAKFRAN